jgi:thiosulfate reductase cytochrome b subunit
MRASLLLNSMCRRKETARTETNLDGRQVRLYRTGLRSQAGSVAGIGLHLVARFASRLCYPLVVSTNTRNPEIPGHSPTVRVTHWLTVIAFFALLLSGLEIVVSHPRFYWGETGNVNMHPLFTIPIPASRGTVPTGYSYTMPDQNGWSRYLHFQAAWLAVLTGFVYVAWGLWNGHFRKHLVPARGQRTWRAYRDVIAGYLRRAPSDTADGHSYNVAQRTAYLAVIFVLFPMMIWTGLALSPSFDSAFPITVNVLGGRQSARTLHFFLTGALVLFVIVHVAMVAQAGFRNRMRAMITGHAEPQQGIMPGPAVSHSIPGETI